MERLDYMVLPGIAGAPADSKDLHLEEVGALPADLAKLKGGIAVMLKDGLAKVSDGTGFYGIRSESPRSFSIGVVDTAVSIGVRRKGVVFAAFSGDVSKVTKGTYLKIAQDGTFTIATNQSEAVGIAEDTANSNIVPMAFNADFYRSAGGGITEVQVDTKITAAKTEVKQTTDKLRTDLDANTNADKAIEGRVKALEAKK